jgi:hypothetical protein
MSSTTTTTTISSISTTEKRRVAIYVNPSITYRVIYNHVQLKQKGFCYHCRCKIVYGERIVRKGGSGARVRYYHLHCAERILVIA